MLILYLLLFFILWILSGVIRFAQNLFYHVKISLLVNTIQSKDDLLLLRVRDYEYAIAEIFRRKGFKVRMSDHFGEGGNGIILDNVYYVITKKECFHHQIEIEQAKILVKHMQDNDIYRGMIITLGDFKKVTKNYCHTHVIQCINGNQLLQMCKDAQTIRLGSSFAGYF